jgi:orotidine-5'-phosphate decarboxylase
MMPFNERLREAIIKRKSSLCVGIDPSIGSFPIPLQKKLHLNPEEIVEEFCKKIIQTTAPYCCAFKPQLAMFSSIGCEKVLERLTAWLIKNFPEHILIIDGKRGDIGSTAEHYASEIFDRYNAHATTINPYMGTDSIIPFIARSDKGLYVLCRTSNPGADEIQNLQLKSGEKLFEKIALIARDKWNKNCQIGLVVGATVVKELKTVSKLCPELPLLIPGIGNQGGSILEVIKATKDKKNTLINSSRSIIFASREDKWSDAAAYQAQKSSEEINKLQSNDDN